jgi:hypothetical protein
MINQSWSIYSAKNKVLVPTSVETTAGVGMEVEPMEVVDIDDTDALKRALLDVITKGNPIVPHPSQDEMSKVTIHKKLGFKSYKAFNHEANAWGVVRNDRIYSIDFYKISDDGRGYNSLPNKRMNFSIDTPVEIVVDKLIEIIQQAHHQKIVKETK